MWVTALIAAVISVAIVMVLAAAETSVLVLTPGRVHRLVEAERDGARELEELWEQRHRLRAASALLAALSHVSWGLLGWIVGGYSGGVVPVLLLIAGVAVSYSFGQALPRAVAATNPEHIALLCAPFALTAERAAYPCAHALGGAWTWAISLTGAERAFSPWAVAAEPRAAGASDEEGERAEAEEALLEAVSEFGEKIVREVMVPRTDMVAIEDTASVAEVADLIATSGVSRVPVYHETVDDVRGVLFAKDLLPPLVAGQTVSVPALIRSAYFVPETKPVEELFVEMRTRTHIAIVADEYGGTAGLVTLEDLLEQLVGDISDEYDKEEPLVTDAGDGHYRVDARLPVDDLNALFGTELDTDTDSVGGLFTEVAGHIPEQGESIELEGLRLTVTELEGTRIRQLRVASAAGGRGDEHEESHPA